MKKNLKQVNDLFSFFRSSKMILVKLQLMRDIKDSERFNPSTSAFEVFHLKLHCLGIFFE